jgi:hypothetical protein
MTKQEKIKDLEAELDNLTDRLRNPNGCPDRIAIMITKEIIQAQISVLKMNFDDIPTTKQPENEIEIKFSIDVDCDAGTHHTLKDEVMTWILINLPNIWKKEDAIINSIKF